MGKARLTDTEKWKESWHRKLPVRIGYLYHYIWENSGHAGLWKVDFDTLEYDTGEKYTLDDIKTHLKDHLIWLSERLVHIPEFIPVNYTSEAKPTKSPGNQYWLSALRNLVKYIPISEELFKLYFADILETNEYYAKLRAKNEIANENLKKGEKRNRTNYPDPMIEIPKNIIISKGNGRKFWEWKTPELFFGSDKIYCDNLTDQPASINSKEYKTIKDQAVLDYLEEQDEKKIAAGNKKVKEDREAIEHKKEIKRINLKKEKGKSLTKGELALFNFDKSARRTITRKKLKTPRRLPPPGPGARA